MSEYELIDVFTSFQVLMQGWITAYFAGITAYLVAAHLAAATLTRWQVALMNGAFVIYCALCATGAFGNYSRQIELAAEIRAVNPARTLMPNEWLLWAMTLTLFGGIALSMKFMWDARHPRRSGQADANP